MTQTYARFYDGESGQRLTVELRIDRAAETLCLEHPDLPFGSQYWPLPCIRALRDHARKDQLVLSLFDDGALDSALITTARLTVEDPDMVQTLQSACANLNRRDLKPGTAKKVATYAGGAAAAIALMIFVIIPALANTMARIIPIEREIAFGQSVVRQMERLLDGNWGGVSLACTNAEGLAALAQMEARLLEATDTAYDLDIVVFDHEMINAFAAPGGQVVLMRGLIESASTPDEVAAVLAHEIGHVESRDPTRNALRVAGSAGLVSMVFGDFTGGSAMVVVAEQMLNASFTREAEAEADLYALQMLDAARVDATGMADFFDGLTALQGEEPLLPVYMSSHPETGSRADAARDFARAQGATSAVLSDQDWQALRGICD